MKIVLITGILALIIGGVAALYAKNRRAPAETMPAPDIASAGQSSGNGSAKPEAVVTVIAGTAAIIVPSGEERTVSGETRAPAGARVKTFPASRARIRFPDDSEAYIDEETEIILLAIEKEKSASVSVRLAAGRIFSRVKQLFSGSRYEIRTSNTLAAVRGTGFDVRFRGGKTDVATLENKVEVTALDPRTQEPLEGVPPVLVEERRSVTLDEADPPAPSKRIEIREVAVEDIRTDQWLMFNIETAIKKNEPLPEVPGLEINAPINEPKPSPTPEPSPESRNPAPRPSPRTESTPTPEPSPTPRATPTPAVSAATVQTPSPSPSPEPSPVAPKLSITQVSPETADPRFADFPFRIFGTGFETGARAFIGAIPLKNTRVISSAEIQALIPGGTPAASYDVLVINPDGERAILGGGIFAIAEFQ